MKSLMQLLMEGMMLHALFSINSVKHCLWPAMQGGRSLLRACTHSHKHTYHTISSGLILLSSGQSHCWHEWGRVVWKNGAKHWGTEQKGKETRNYRNNECLESASRDRWRREKEVEGLEEKDRETKRVGKHAER